MRRYYMPDAARRPPRPAPRLITTKYIRHEHEHDTTTRARRTHDARQLPTNQIGDGRDAAAALYITMYTLFTRVCGR